MADWKTTEINLLRQIYPTQTRSAICAALPRHSWVGIRNCASRYELRRSRPDPLHPVIARLIERRKQLGVSQASVALKSGLNRFSINRHEMGRGGFPSIDTVERWGAALSMKITISEADQSVA